jgi:hypothetical protein
LDEISACRRSLSIFDAKRLFSASRECSQALASDAFWAQRLITIGRQARYAADWPEELLRERVEGDRRVQCHPATIVRVFRLA